MMSKKTYIIFLIILIAFFAIMFYFFGAKELKAKKNTAIIIIGDQTIWRYSNKKWFSVSTSSDLSSIDWKKYHVFTDNKKVGNYYLWHDDKCYAFDDKKNAIPLQGELFAYRSNYDINLLKFEQEEIADDDQYVVEVLEKHDINDNKFTSNYKVSFDFDNDGEVEDFYVISNVFADDFTPDTIFSIVFMVKNGEIHYIYDDVSANHIYNGCKPYFQAFFDVDSDSTYEFILSCGHYSNIKRNDMLYKFKDNEFKIVISN